MRAYRKEWPPTSWRWVSLDESTMAAPTRVDEIGKGDPGTSPTTFNASGIYPQKLLPVVTQESSEGTDSCQHGPFVPIYTATWPTGLYTFLEANHISVITSEILEWKCLPEDSRRC